MIKIEENELFNERYRLISLLGVGGYSQVWLAEDTDINKEVALKIFAAGSGLDNEALKTFSKEYSIVFDLNHPNLLIPKHFDKWEKMPYLVMPYISKGSCLKLCGKMDESELAKFLLQIGEAVQYLHSQEPPIIHQDIKPDNILIDNKGNYLLTDFGISTKIRRTLTKSIGQKTASSGTTAYMAPEKFSVKLSDKAPIKANDIFSLGVCMFELLTDELPCGDLGGILLSSGGQTAELPENYSPNLKKLIASCLSKDTWERPTAEELVEVAKNYQKGGEWWLPERIQQEQQSIDDNLENEITETHVEVSEDVNAIIQSDNDANNLSETNILDISNQTNSLSSDNEQTPLEKAIAAGVFEEYYAKRKYRPSEAELKYFYQALKNKYGEIKFSQFIEICNRYILPKNYTSYWVVGILIFIAIIFVITIAVNSEDKQELPIINTGEIVELTDNTVTIVIDLVDSGKTPIKETGVCYSTEPNVTIESGSFIAELSDNSSKIINGLQPNTTYFARAFAKNSVGIAYGDEVTFKTLNGFVFIDDFSGKVKTFEESVSSTCDWKIENGYFKGIGKDNRYSYPKLFNFQKASNSSNLEISVSIFFSNAGYYNNAGGGLVLFEGGNNSKRFNIVANGQYYIGEYKNENWNGSYFYTSLIKKGEWNEIEVKLDDGKLNYYINSTFVASREAESFGYVFGVYIDKAPCEVWFDNFRIYGHYSDDITTSELPDGTISGFIDDRDGEIYKTVKIGDQIWMAENLSYSVNNEFQRQITDDKEWGSNIKYDGWCFYDNKISNKSIYGVLYQWEAARNACPEGWHLPSKREFETLLSYYDNASRSYDELLFGGSSGFSILSGGWRFAFEGDFGTVDDGFASFWSASALDNEQAWCMIMNNGDNTASIDSNNRSLGTYVRCVKD
jgi:uncharacterized protein (TIGR02145 family)